MWLLKPIDSSSKHADKRRGAFSITVMLAVISMKRQRQEHKRELTTNLALKRLKGKQARGREEERQELP